MSRRQNTLPDNFSDLPAFQNMDGLESYQFSGIRDYARGWARFDELTETQQNILNMVNEGVNGRLSEVDMPQYLSLIHI